MVVSDPMAELPIRNAKYAKNCTELHLGNKSLTVLDGFEPFVSLEVLWLNNNQLTNLGGLESNFRIKKLYAHENSITNLKGTVGNFKFLDTLLLFNNHIRDLSACLDCLRPCRKLYHLDLFGNPLAEETNYRLKVIKALPWLHVLDRRKITLEERNAAKALVVPKVNAKGTELPPIGSTNTQAMSIGGSLANSLSTSLQTSLANSLSSSLASSKRGSNLTGKPMLRANTEEELQSIKQLEGLLKKIGTTVKTKRLLLKEEFFTLDRRREHVIIERDFVRILDLYGLWNPEDDPGAQSTLLDHYTAETPVRCTTLGRDSHLQDSRFIDYIAFCADIEPSSGGRDLDNLERTLQAQWRVKNSAISMTTKDLQKEVTKTMRRRRKKEEASRRAMVKLDTTIITGKHQKGNQVDHTRPSFSEVAKDMLDALEELQLKNFFKNKDKDGNGFLSQQELREALQDMELIGRKALITPVDPFQQTSRSQSSSMFGGSEPMSPKSVRDSNAKDSLDLLFNRIDSNDDGKISWQEFLKYMKEGRGRVERVKWGRLSVEEAAVKSKALFDQADRLYKNTALRGGVTSETQSQLGELVSFANKLQSIAKPTEGQKKSRKKQAHGRRDVFKTINYSFEEPHTSPQQYRESKTAPGTSFGEPDTEKLKRMFMLKDEEYTKFQEQRATRNRTGFQVSMAAV
mmetsp:Transcript_9498/g.12434  ORF Transcript_9498/g.12434 Transcript_9498/m.12434 type:complete len:686 (-) Transcript_9498:284-2341(-)